jgi:chromosome segregation ATPase
MGEQEHELEKLEVWVTREMAEDLRALLQEEGWTQDEGLRLILGAGMGAVRAAQAEADLENEALPEANDAPPTFEAMRRRLIHVEASLAVLRFRLFEAQEANRAWNLSTGAIQAENVGLNALVKRQKEDIEALKARLAELEAALRQATSAPAPPAPASEPPSGGGWGRLRRLWPRGRKAAS